MLFPVQETSFQVYKPIQFPDSSGHLRFCTANQLPMSCDIIKHESPLTPLVFVNVQYPLVI